MDHIKHTQQDVRQMLSDMAIKEFLAELDQDIMNRIADGRLIWDGAHLRDSNGVILE